MCVCVCVHVCVCVCVCVSGSQEGPGQQPAACVQGRRTGVEEGVWDRAWRLAWGQGRGEDRKAGPQRGAGAGGRARALATEEPSIAAARTCLEICPQTEGLGEAPLRTPQSWEICLESRELRTA